MKLRRVNIIAGCVWELALGSMAVPSYAQLAATPTADQVLSEAKSAAGGAALDQLTSLHQISSVSTAGLSGTHDEYDDMQTGRYVAHDNLGPTATAQGFDGSKSWSTDESGVSRYRTSDNAKRAAITNTYLVTNAYWYPAHCPGRVSYLRTAVEGSRTFDVLRMLPVGGYPIEAWFDSTTHLLDRIKVTYPSGTETSYYSDYRSVAGVVLPYSERDSDGKAQDDNVATVQSVNVNVPLNSVDFGLPAPPAPDYTFDGGATSVTVPFSEPNGTLMFPASLNGHPYLAYFDSGGAYMISTQIQSQLSLQSEGKLQMGQLGGAQTVDAGLAKVDTITIGKLTLHNAVFTSVDDGWQNPMVGYELLERFVVRVDYSHMTVTFTDPNAFQYHGRGISVPMTLSDHTPEVRGAIDGIPGNFTIDTGDEGSLQMFWPFVASRHLLAHYRPKFDLVAGAGCFGQLYRAWPARVHVLSLGGATVVGPLTSLDESVAGGPSASTEVAGNIGTRILRQFNITFDYPHQRIILERSSNWGTQDTFNRTGIFFNPADGNSTTVFDLAPGGPGAIAGIRKGDVIESVNGHQILPGRGAWSAAIHKPVGTKLHLTVLTDGKPRAVTIVLRDLV